MTVESRRKIKEAFKLLPGVVLADDLQEALEKHYENQQKRKGHKNIDLERIRIKANKATNILREYFENNLGRDYCSFVDDEANYRHWYFTKKAVDLVLNARRREDLALSPPKSQVYIIKESQFEAIQQALQSIV